MVTASLPGHWDYKVSCGIVEPRILNSLSSQSDVMNAVRMTKLHVKMYKMYEMYKKLPQDKMKRFFLVQANWGSTLEACSCELCSATIVLVGKFKQLLAYQMLSSAI